MRKAPLKRQTKKQSQLRKTTKKSNTFEFGVFDFEFDLGFLFFDFHF